MTEPSGSLLLFFGKVRLFTGALEQAPFSEKGWMYVPCWGNIFESGIVVHRCNLSTQEAEVGGSMQGSGPTK